MDNLDYSEYQCGSHLLEDQLFLSRCQVDTPDNVVDFFWRLIGTYREKMGKVVDLGAGDGRFAGYGNYKQYTGFEIDGARLGTLALPKNARIEQRCAFGIQTQRFDTCIGNPPYVKHHDLDSEWHENITEQLRRDLDAPLMRTANLFILFLAQAIAITTDKGLVAQIIPYEWVSRPSTKPIRDLINTEGWNVDVYRFKSSVFPRVLTTACVTVIDKATSSGKWSYHEIDSAFKIKQVRRMTGTRHNVIKYTKRGKNNFAQRGLSPGGNKVFCLTEGERLHHGLVIDRDVRPCLISLKPLPNETKVLSRSAFTKHYVEAGERCWLINADPTPSAALMGYLNKVPDELISNATCSNQTPWWSYKEHDVPTILYNPGIVAKTPQFVENQANAIAVGSVFGIHSLSGISKRFLRSELSKVNFRDRLVSYAKVLRRVEVNQMNTVINEVLKKHGRR